jgi:tRNA(Ile)-lysidine synthase
VIEKELDSFLDRIYDKQRPVLLALSGGIDSLALFFSLLRYCKKREFMFASAHVDHGWRKESGKEAKALEKLCHENDVPFHLKTLDPKTLQGNLEEACREERLHFFGELSLEHDYQAVILAHHADDLAEGVMKRLFEGAHLARLFSMKKVSYFEGLAVWRPFLKVPKKKLESYVNSLSVPFVDDETNRDEKFLRARLRVKMFPYLAEIFGKEIAKPLAEIAEESSELFDYLEKKSEKEFKKIDWGKSEMVFSPETRDLLELKWLII